MRTRHATTSILAASALLAAAVPVGAADTEVQFTVEASSSALSVSVANPGVPVSVDDGGSNPVVDALSGASFTDTLPAVTVTDQRGQLLAGWTLTVTGEDFTSTTDPADVIGAENARVYNAVADATALTTVLGGLLSGMTLLGPGEYDAGTNSLAAPYTLISGNTTLGNGSVAVVPTIAITVPDGAQAGTYTGTVSYTAS